MPTKTTTRRPTASEVAIDRARDLQAAIADLKGHLSPLIDEMAAELLEEVEAHARLDLDYCLPCGEYVGHGRCYDCSEVAHERSEARREEALAQRENSLGVGA